MAENTTCKGRENSTLQDLQRQEDGGECIWNINEQIQCTTGHHGAKTRDIIFTCVVLHNMLRASQGGADRAPTRANDVVV